MSKAREIGYAAGTQVSVEKSRAELDALLAKHGCSARGIMSDAEIARALSDGTMPLLTMGNG